MDDNEMHQVSPEDLTVEQWTAVMSQMTGMLFMSGKAEAVYERMMLSMPDDLRKEFSETVNRSVSAADTLSKLSADLGV